MRKSLTITLSNSFGVIVLGDNGFYRISELKGLETTSREISRNDNYRADGAKLEYRRLREKEIYIRADYFGKGEEDERQKLTQMLNAKESLHMTVNRNGIERVINVEIDIFRLPIDNLYDVMELELELVALDPYMTDENETLVDLNNWVGGVTFPLQLPFTLKTKGDTNVNVVNNGHVSTPVTIYFKGAGVNPKITNKTTGEYIKVIRTLTAEQTLIITTGFGNKTVTIVNADGSEDNAFNYIDLNSKFFDLEVGDNVITYSTDSQTPSGVQIAFKNRYNGI